MYLCENLLSGKKSAVKIVEKRLQKAGMEDRFKEEIYLVKSLNNPYIIQVQEFFEDEERLYVCFEYCRGGELF